MVATSQQERVGARSGVDNNLFSDLTFSNCALAYHQLAPDINRNSKGQCLQAFDTPSMGYMDKTVFWRNRVVGGGGVKLEPCRADCLNVSAAALVRLLACLKEAGRTDVDRVRVRQR